MLFRPTPDPPGPGQESVWQFPRPARAEPCTRLLSVQFGGRTIAETRRGVRVIETSHPPSYYFPPDDIEPAALIPVAGSSFCEWKGAASYRDVVAGDLRAPRAAWTYLNPSPDFTGIRGFVAFYPAAMDACFVDGERVRAQEGGFYGGWITSHVAGPFKGAPGSGGW